jgi:hypothetical protein
MKTRSEHASKVMSRQKLSLTKTTLRLLSSRELGRVAGAAIGHVTVEDCHTVGTYREEPTPDPLQ